MRTPEDLPHAIVLIAEDDDEDYEAVEMALDASDVVTHVYRARDGVELLEWLTDPAKPRPGVILLDLNMPRKNGIEALQEMKDSPVLRYIPVVALTTSRSDVDRCHELGINAYMTKPTLDSELQACMRMFERFWFRAATLPSRANRAA